MDEHSVANIADVFCALAWPVATLVIAYWFRRPITDAMSRLKAVTVGGLTADLDDIVTRSAEVIGLTDIGHMKSPESQLPLIEVVARLSHRTGYAGLNERVESLAREYDSVRAGMKSGPDRTRALEAIAARMRLFAAPVRSHFDALIGSESAGKRLMAILSLQVYPDESKLEWLLRRFEEERAFVQYHAALALQSAIRAFSDSSPLRAQIEQVLLRLGPKAEGSDRAMILRKSLEELDTARRAA